MSSTTHAPVAIPPADVRTAQPVRTKANVTARSAADGASRSGVWVAIFAITMSFAAFTSALFVREGSAVDWTHLVLPPILYANTLVLLLGSVTLWRASRTVNAHELLDSHVVKAVMGWLITTFALGLLFIAGQYEAWRQLAAQGLFLATNPNSSFFYVFTGMHILHLLGGIAALVYLVGQLVGSRTTFRRAAFHNTAIYWHFMGVLWLYLLFVLRTKL
ncbi:MAG: cytochrome c oxidase subunit [Acidobacteriaceae bacterium]|jgi:cytochrome c oxidase subunit 3|nr:cytochrome c oxidase subunit [Acidobacteriaceae bacterium]